MAGRRAATTDHAEVRGWVERQGAKPAQLRGSAAGEDLGILDLDFSDGRDELLERVYWLADADASIRIGRPIES